MHGLAGRYCFLHPRSGDSEFEEADGGVRCELGQRVHYSQGHGHGTTSQLSVQNDHLFCHFGTRTPFPASTRSLADRFQTLAPVVSLDIIEESILPILDQLVADDIPNIRFNVAKSYSVLIDTLRRLPAEGTLADLEKSGETKAPSPKGQEIIQQKILPNLAKLQEDEDVDVRYFATTAAGGHEGVMETAP